MTSRAEDAKVDAMTGLLTHEETPERYCLQECDGSCGERGQCMQKPGHLHDHDHCVYDYSGSGSHTWHREVPNKRDIYGLLKQEATDGLIGVERAAELIDAYLKATAPRKSSDRKPWWRRG